MVNSIGFYSGDSSEEGVRIPLVGLTVEYVSKVKNPTGSTEYPEVGMVMLRVLNDPRPVPLVVGLIDAQGAFQPFNTLLLTMSPEMYPHINEDEVIAVSSNITWEEYRQQVEKSYFIVEPLVGISPYVIDPDTGVGYVEVDRSTLIKTPLPPKVQDERTKLLLNNTILASLNYSNLIGKTPPKKTGVAYAELEKLAIENGLPYFILDTGLDLHIIKLK